MIRIAAPILAVALAACGPAQSPAPVSPETTDDAPATAVEAAQPAVDSAKLATVLAAQGEEHQARYQYRHPKETLEFFGVAPGMTVAEVLPGGGWYSQLLLPYLGSEGTLVGITYDYEMWPKFGIFSAEDIEARFSGWTTKWPEQAKSWGEGDRADVAATEFGSVPDELADSVDVVLFVRALHNLSRFEADGGYLTTALAETYKILKPGGIVGVVQHQAPDSKSDEWADGSHGYLKRDNLITAMEAAGFEYVADSDINANPKDQPGEDDIVWRLPPTFATSRDNPELKAEMAAIGESNRMTLKFRKPAE
ncbi:MAG: class I SAM-dependent methyltransferase [Haliangiales bacterium]